MLHRGPDEAGEWIGQGAGLAHRRLKVIDLIGGQQPFLSDDRQRVLVYNGEIYNFRALRQTLKTRGVPFRSLSDTEVLAHLLAKHGAGAVEQISGMFAFGHWNESTRTLTLARDRLGKKPLYYFADETCFAFASELNALLILLNRRFDLDPVALDQFFAHGRVAGPRTIYHGIRLLEPATVLTLEAANDRWNQNTRRYWEPTLIDTPADDQDAVDAFEELLSDAVTRRLVSDVPIGCLLSGGIDSSLITALATKASGGAIKAFSIGFDESEQLNELPYAQMVATALGCDWKHRLVRGGDFLATLDETASFFGQPFANFAMFPTRLLAQMAREELTVVLSGQGGDELAAGYPGRYGWVHEAAAAARERSKRATFAPAVDDLLLHLQHTSFLPWPNAREAIFADHVRDAVTQQATPYDELRSTWSRTDLHQGERLRRIQHADCAVNLPDYLITIEERMTMAASLEARNPFLDERVAQFLLSLPAEKKLRQTPRGFEAKWIVRELARRHVPAAAIDRPKRGFTPPLDLWLKQHAPAVRTIIEDADPIIGSLFTPAWKQALRTQPPESLPLMAVFYTLMMSVWARQHTGSLTGNIATAATTSSPRASSPWQGLLRERRHEDITEARWICQALGNLNDGSAITIIGDEDDYFAELARGCSLRLIESDDRDTNTAAVLLVNRAARSCAGFDAAGDADVHWPASSAGTVLMLVSCSMQEANDLPAKLAHIGQRLHVRGRQAVQIGADRVLFIVRGEGHHSPSLSASIHQ